MGNEVSSEITKEDLIELKKKQLLLEKENKKIRNDLEKQKKTKNITSGNSSNSKKKVSFTLNEKNVQLDPYDIFQLEPDCTIEDIKKSYKKLVIKFHPDKSGYNSAEEYKTIQKAYALLISIKNDELQYIQKQNQTMETKQNERNDLEQHIEQKVNYHFEPSSGPNFSNTKFNTMFEQNKFVDESDRGYNDWLKDDSNFSNQAPKISSKEKFNESFEQYIQQQSASKQIIEYIDPDTLISTSTNYGELGADVNDFTNHGKYTDLKKAYTDTTLHPGTVKNRGEYNSLEQLKAARNGPLVLTDQEREYIERKKMQDEQLESSRRNKMREHDDLIEQHYARIHGRAIELPNYKR